MTAWELYLWVEGSEIVCSRQEKQLTLEPIRKWIERRGDKNKNTGLVRCYAIVRVVTSAQTNVLQKVVIDNTLI